MEAKQTTTVMEKEVKKFIKQLRIWNWIIFSFFAIGGLTLLTDSISDYIVERRNMAEEAEKAETELRNLELALTDSISFDKYQERIDYVINKM